MNYSDFITRKLTSSPPTGLQKWPALPVGLFDHQESLTKWSLRRGRSAIFADTGLGKTRMELAWGDAVHKQTGDDVLILAPLAVAEQTVREGLQIGVAVNHIHDDAEHQSGINIVNYERLHRANPARYGAVVLDESSIIKHHDAKTLKTLLDVFRATPFKLCATATPAPNDWTELGTHAEFLGICTRSEMLAEYFVHDGAETQVWRLKGHARHLFWKWVSSWGAMIRKPSDLGFDDAAYNLPPLSVTEHIVKADIQQAGLLFALEANTLSERRDARRASMSQRVDACVERVNTEDDQSWVVWCDLNAESEALTAAIDGAVEVRGSMDMDKKEAALLGFAQGKHRVIVTKPSIAGFGLNWQHCARMAFVGVTDSYEAYYQAVRRCWRFGQSRPVDVHIYASDLEGAVVANLRRKERDAAEMSEALSTETNAAVREEVIGNVRHSNPYHAQARIKTPSFLQGAA